MYVNYESCTGVDRAKVIIRVTDNKQALLPGNRWSIPMSYLCSEKYLVEV